MPKWMDRFFHAVGDQINARRLFIKYSCALILPVLVLVLFVQSRYIDQVEGHYQDSLDMYASELAIEMDDVFARIRVTAESIFTDEEKCSVVSSLKAVAKLAGGECSCKNSAEKTAAQKLSGFVAKNTR